MNEARRDLLSAAYPHREEGAEGELWVKVNALRYMRRTLSSVGSRRFVGVIVGRSRIGVVVTDILRRCEKFV